MKNIKIMVLGLALFGLASCCCDKTPRQLSGFIAEASMNTVTVKAATSDSTYTFSTGQADKCQANGMLLGAPVVVDYIGKFQEGMEATKIVTDPTYEKAIGKWVMIDPINAESVMGVELMIEGEAQSINMATLRYSNWGLQGEENTIYLKGISEGSGAPIEFTETATIAKDEKGLYTLSIKGTNVILTKQAE